MYALYMSGNPAQYMTVIGVTGTNGKTTTCSIIHFLLQSLWLKSVYVWTTGVLIGNEEMKWVRKMTSYDPMALQHILSEAYKAGCTHAVLEVSSHGLHQKRFNWIPFSVGVLTNITNEHLDYHKTMIAYAGEKQKLFRKVQETRKEPRAAILPSDDSRWKKRWERMQFGMKLMYGLRQSGWLTIDNMEQKKSSTTVDISYLQKSHTVDIPLVWAFNMRNILAAVGAVISLWYRLEDIVPHLSSYKQVAGRQEHYVYHEVDRYIDYAHTPHGLEVMLKYIKSIVGDWKVICLFGAPGKRDIDKRPVMWEVVDRFADIVIVTDDDAAKENRWDILRDVAAGVTRNEWENFMVIPHREHAIHLAATLAKPWDVVLLAGIWHQDVLDTNFGYIPWSEKGMIEKAYETLK